MVCGAVVIGFNVEGGGGGTVTGGGRGHKPGNRRVNQVGSGWGQRCHLYSNKHNKILKLILAKRFVTGSVGSIYFLPHDCQNHCWSDENSAEIKKLNKYIKLIKWYSFFFLELAENQ